MAITIVLTAVLILGSKAMAMTKKFTNWLEVVSFGLVGAMGASLLRAKATRPRLSPLLRLQCKSQWQQSLPRPRSCSRAEHAGRQPDFRPRVVHDAGSRHPTLLRRDHRAGLRHVAAAVRRWSRLSPGNLARCYDDRFAAGAEDADTV